MREIRTSGSEGGGALTGSPYLYEAGPHQLHTKVRRRELGELAYLSVVAHEGLLDLAEATRTRLPSPMI